jgi:serine/threonine protein kinase
VNILNRLRCPYVLNFIGASHVEGKRCIVTEICKHGSVADLVFSDKSFNYLQVLKVALDMAKGITFLHAYPPHPHQTSAWAGWLVTAAAVVKKNHPRLWVHTQERSASPRHQARELPGGVGLCQGGRLL